MGDTTIAIQNNDGKLHPAAEPVEEPFDLVGFIKYGSGTAVPLLLADAALKGGGGGAIAAAIAAFVIGRHGPGWKRSLVAQYDRLDDRSKLAIARVKAWGGQDSEIPVVTEVDATAEEVVVPDVKVSKPVQAFVQSQQLPPMPRVKPKEAEPWDAWYVEAEKEDRHDLLPTPKVDGKPAKFTFSQVLAKGFKPTLNGIYLGRIIKDGVEQDCIVPVKNLCHVALAGSTGKGKGTIMRLITSQLCHLGLQVLMLNPHWMGYDESGGEDWTPFERKGSNGKPYFMREPIPCSKIDYIEECLEGLVRELYARIERKQKYEALGKPYFVIIDEWPDIVAERKSCVKYVSKLLREGRKYGIYVVIASQDFQVKTIGVDGGGVRKCLDTVLYVGGDAATARALLDDEVVIDEKKMGKGTIMLRCTGTDNETLVAQVPFVDNEALYQLLGPSLLDPVTHLPLDWQADDEDDFEMAMKALPDIDPYDSRYSDEPTGASANAPQTRSKPNLRVVGSSEEARGSSLIKPVVSAECAPGSFLQRSDDLLLSERQGALLEVYYRDFNNVAKALAAIKNNRGQGLGARYTRHANYLLEKAGLKARRA